LLASPGTSYPIDSTDAEKSKNPTDEPIERLLVRAREDGYNNGWKAGKAVGYKIGREDGQDLGMMEGKKIGVAQGKEIGMAVGLAEGKLQSKDLAKRESWQDWAAWDAGFSQGLEIGKSNARHG
jgi:flagellar biosynthesis/type III secretory pathway protein FliH